MNRGDRREAIFLDEDDRRRFIGTLAERLRLGTRAYAVRLLWQAGR